MERINNVRSHLAGVRVQESAGKEIRRRNTSGRSPDDVVIVSALRTPIGKAKRGSFKDATPDTLLVAVLKATIQQTGIDPATIGNIVIGNVLQPGAGAAMARMAQFMAGIPHTVPLNTVNRQCSSGLQAVADIAHGIKAGCYDIGIAGGVESMTVNSQTVPPDVNWEKVFEAPEAKDCTIPMGITSENVASAFNVSRQEQDSFALESQKRAAKAVQEGRFKAEIVPVKVNFVDQDGNEKEIVVEKDDGVRADTTLEKLNRLRPSFKEDGTTTAGNSSQVSDGAAAVLLMKRSVAERLNLPVMGVFRSFMVAGVPPDVMGIGPKYAIPLALQKAGLKIDDIDVFEINEAFASQAVYCVKELGIPPAKVNPNGGAIALGHPLGCTGSRQVATLLHELKRSGGRLGVVSMCVGTGMGAAAVFERE